MMFSLSRRQGFFGPKRCLILLSLLLLAFTVLRLTNKRRVFGDEPSIFPGETISESEIAFLREIERSADEISVRELNECHRALLARMMRPSDWKLRLRLQYAGIVQVEGHTVITGDNLSVQFVKGLNIESEQDIASPLEWNVSSEKSAVVIFSISITVRKTDFTVAEIPLEKRTLYANVGFVDENEEITKKRDDLGGVSILEFVKRLEKGPSDLEKKE